MSETALAITAAEFDGIFEINGRQVMEDAKGRYVLVSQIRAEDLLQDQTVRKIMAYAVDLNAQVNRFRDHTMVDLGTFDAILSEKYNAKIGGAKGNRTYQTIDGLMKVQVQVSDQVAFGPELQVAKDLIDECLTEWSADSREEIQALIMRAFNTDKEGQINKSDLFMLLRLEIKDERWVRAGHGGDPQFHAGHRQQGICSVLQALQEHRWMAGDHDRPGEGRCVMRRLTETLAVAYFLLATDPDLPETDDVQMWEGAFSARSRQYRHDIGKAIMLHGGAYSGTVGDHELTLNGVTVKGDDGYRMLLATWYDAACAEKAVA